MYQIINKFKFNFNLDTKIKNLMKIGFLFSFNIFIISCLILITYKLFYNSPFLYYIGLHILKLSCVYFVSFLCFGFAFNKIINEI